MTALVVTDLDRTLVYSARRLAGADPGSLVCVEWQDGVGTSWMTRAAAGSLVELASRTTWVPVTTRTTAEYRRLVLPAVPRYAVCAHGGVLLVDGRPDAAWAAAVARTVAAAAPVEEAVAVLDRWRAEVPDGVVGTPRVAEGLFLVASLDPAVLPEGRLDGVRGALAGLGWSVRPSDRKLYAFPAGLDKAAAVDALAARLPAATVLATGDSALDEPMLRRADAAIVPRHGELSGDPAFAGTDASGVAAGAEILAWLLARAG